MSAAGRGGAHGKQPRQGDGPKSSAEAAQRREAKSNFSAVESPHVLLLFGAVTMDIAVLTSLFANFPSFRWVTRYDLAARADCQCLRGVPLYLVRELSKLLPPSTAVADYQSGRELILLAPFPDAASKAGAVHWLSKHHVDTSRFDNSLPIQAEVVHVVSPSLRVSSSPQIPVNWVNSLALPELERVPLARKRSRQDGPGVAGGGGLKRQRSSSGKLVQSSLEGSDVAQARERSEMAAAASTAGERPHSASTPAWNGAVQLQLAPVSSTAPPHLSRQGSGRKSGSRERSVPRVQSAADDKAKEALLRSHGAPRSYSVPRDEEMASASSAAPAPAVDDEELKKLREVAAAMLGKLKAKETSAPSSSSGGNGKAVMIPVVPDVREATTIPATPAEGGGASSQSVGPGADAVAVILPPSASPRTALLQNGTAMEGEEEGEIVIALPPPPPPSLPPRKDDEEQLRAAALQKLRAAKAKAKAAAPSNGNSGSAVNNSVGGEATGQQHVQDTAGVAAADANQISREPARASSSSNGGGAVAAGLLAVTLPAAPPQSAAAKPLGRPSSPPAVTLAPLAARSMVGAAAPLIARDEAPSRKDKIVVVAPMGQAAVSFVFERSGDTSDEEGVDEWWEKGATAHSAAQPAPFGSFTRRATGGFQGHKSWARSAAIGTNNTGRYNNGNTVWRGNGAGRGPASAAAVYSGRGGRGGRTGYATAPPAAAMPRPAVAHRATSAPATIYGGRGAATSSAAASSSAPALAAAAVGVSGGIEVQRRRAAELKSLLVAKREALRKQEESLDSFRTQLLPHVTEDVHKKQAERDRLAARVAELSDTLGEAGDGAQERLGGKNSGRPSASDFFVSIA